jgi:hypothetical protein
MRDLRSTLAYLVTANRSCEQVHRAHEGDAPADVIGAEGRFWQRAFLPPADADELLRAMGRLDPGRLPRPRLDRFLALHEHPDEIPAVRGLFAAHDFTASTEVAPTHYLDEPARLASLKRRLYFLGEEVEIDDVPLAPGVLLPYRHADRFFAALRGEEDLDGLLAELGRGISRSDGIASELLGNRLCVRVHHSDAQQLTVLKEFPLGDFRLRVIRPTRGIPVEAIPETLGLSYRDGTPRLTIELDLFELLLRFAEGVRPTAPEYQPLLEDLAPFKHALNLVSTRDLVLLEAERRIHRVTQCDGKVVRVAAAR